METRTRSLNLEVEELERVVRAGCNSTSTHPICTCPPPLSRSVAGL